MGALKKLQEGIGDLAELKVETFSGQVSGKIATSASDKKDVLDWEKIFSEAKASGEVDLIALTAIKIDGDTRLFFSSAATPMLLEAHQAAVDAATDYRQGLVEAFADVIGIR